MKNGAYRYLVPKGHEHQWDGKTEFKLGKTLAEAHRVYAGRIASVDGAITTIGSLLDRYALEVTPTKAKYTQKKELPSIQRLRSWVGTNAVVDFKPRNAYQLRDHIKQSATRGSGEKMANRHMALLKNVFTKAIEWGAVEDHPMTGGKFKMFPESKSQLHIPTFDEVEEALELANPTLQAFVKLNLMTGLRVTDQLGIGLTDIKADRMTVKIGKTAKTTEKVLEFMMTPELEKVLAECKVIKPLSIYLFHTRRGQSYLADDRSYEGFSSMWSRWMAKLPKEQRFGVRTLRNLVGSQDDLATASERLGHASSTTTQKHYRSNTSQVTPLSSNRNSRKF
ncbi:tyrosine-type recombinase/integrase [Gammaproteobacteria bacterium]|nr:tyrosine-type recombinase/integrase [Gammaproteobacteria bacterium]